MGISFSDNIFLNKLKGRRPVRFLLDLIINEYKNENYFSLGCEYKIKKLVGIKAGYKSRVGSGFQDVDYLRNLRAGVGIKFKSIRIDYSFALPNSSGLNMLNFLSMSLKI